MKRRTRKRLFSILLTVVMLFVCVFSTTAFAEEVDTQNAQVYKYEINIGPGGIGTVRPMSEVTPTTPYVIAMDLWGGYTTELIPFVGGNAISVSASVTDENGGSIIGAFVKTMIIEDGTGNVPLNLSAPVDGNIYTKTGFVKDGGEYRINCFINSPYQDCWVKYYVAVVLFTAD